LRDDDVVEGLVAFAEAGEADFNDHAGRAGEEREEWAWMEMRSACEDD
jgi:hypothetical protein